MASPDEMAKAMIANMREKTGKTLEQWLAIARNSKATKHGELVKLLKTDHGMTHGFANLVAHKTFRSDAGSVSATSDLIAAQYAGDKAVLKPIYDAVIEAAKACGDIEIAPKRAYVSLRRSKQFAIVQPSTRTRLDLGLNLKDTPAQGRLERSGAFNAMVSHRVRLERPDDVDADVKAWIKKAWSAA
jgi:Domain of unknown function (DUF5655)/Domain of unknown function (DUF4287)